MRRVLATLLAAVLLDPGMIGAVPSTGGSGATTTPIKLLVIIFQENVSFDHYFATYPWAANPDGQPAFYPKPNTPTVNGRSGGLLTLNPNLNPANGTAASSLFRLAKATSIAIAWADLGGFRR